MFLKFHYFIVQAEVQCYGTLYTDEWCCTGGGQIVESYVTTRLGPESEAS